MKISAVLITKNEEAVIGRCIKSLRGVDEVVVLDTGSTDKTVAIATELGAKVTVLESPIVPFHFAEARNRANALAKGEWIISIDADEVLRPGGIRKLVRAIEEPQGCTAFVVTFINQAEGDGTRSVAIKKIKIHKAGHWEWQYRVHEQFKPKDVANSKVGDLAAVSMEHLPIPNKSIRHSQNIDLLKLCVEESPEYTRAFKHLGQELMLRKEWIQAIPYLAQYAEKTQEGPLQKSEVLMHIGRCYVETSKLDEGLKWFEISFAEDSRRREPLYHAAMGLINACRLEEALEYAKRMLAIPVSLKPNSHMDLPDVWLGTPGKIFAFCTAEIARAKAAFASQNS